VAWPHPRRASEPNEGHLKHRQVQLICVGASGLAIAPFLFTIVPPYGDGVPRNRRIG
jgi:hypothetical protein